MNKCYEIDGTPTSPEKLIIANLKGIPYERVTFNMVLNFRHVRPFIPSWRLDEILRNWRA